MNPLQKQNLLGRIQKNMPQEALRIAEIAATVGLPLIVTALICLSNRKRLKNKSQVNHDNSPIPSAPLGRPQTDLKDQRPLTTNVTRSDKHTRSRHANPGNPR